MSTQPQDNPAEYPPLLFPENPDQIPPLAPASPPQPQHSFMNTLLEGLHVLIISLWNIIPVWESTNTAFNMAAQTMINSTNTMANLAINQAPQNLEPCEQMKTEPPAIYNGDSERVEAFLRECNIYFGMVNVMDLQKQVNFVLAKTQEGTGKRATIWADSVRAQIEEYQERTPPEFPYNNWREFKEDFI
ncbi:hypothetical protein CVT25_007182 [Psilocybe cyanescens]|uniref:Uncharacterized protein n=1 Tax=Psilocybe cyanescens TaxID=93625 RepID=A0A409X735_PSICY|nr:hypothetical protein CVT25_007182 [Psilocybe cyanescens]